MILFSSLRSCYNLTIKSQYIKTTQQEILPYVNKLLSRDSVYLVDPTTDLYVS